MSSIYLLEWDHVNPDQYNDLIQELRWFGKLKNQNVAYSAGHEGGSLMVIDAWESPKAFDLFLKTRFQQALIKAGMPQPKITSWWISGPRPVNPMTLWQSAVYNPKMSGQWQTWEGFQENFPVFCFN